MGRGTGFSATSEESEAPAGFGCRRLGDNQRKILEQMESSVEIRGKAKAAAGKRKPLRHQLHRKPTATQQAHWEAVQQAKTQEPYLRAIARELEMVWVATRQYALAEGSSTTLPSVKERAKSEALAEVQIAAD